MWFLEALGAAREKHRFHLWAWVLMPEHVHLVIWIPNRATISAILKSIKLPVARRAVYWLKINDPAGLACLKAPGRLNRHHFWQQGGGYERVLRSAPDVHEKIRYIHANPVRRGLVDSATDWNWSSAKAWETDEKDLIALDCESVPAVVT
jgi:putative transposase